MDLTIVYIIIIALLIACSSFFSMSETAFTSASVIRLKKMAQDGDVRAGKAVMIIEDYDKFLTTVLIGNNLVNIAGTSLATLVFALLLGAESGAVFSTVSMTVLVLIFGEIIPKSIAKQRPERVCIRVCGAIRVLEIVLSPVSWMFRKLTAAISRGEEGATITEDELKVMIDEIEDEGVLEKRESELIKSAIRFDDIQVSEVYIPRMDVEAVDISMTPDEVGEVFVRTGYSRLPAYENTIDNIIGVIYAKEFYADQFKGTMPEVRDLVRPIKSVPETASIANLMADFQKSKIHMAVVLDSYGGTMGIVTMEDLLEELVGEIWDESDEVQHDVTAVSDGVFKVKGTANIFDVMEKIELPFDPEGYEDYSVNGYICYKLGRGPARGDTVRIPHADIVVKGVKGRRVTEVEFRKEESPQED
ncbi:MAG: HlyC/CorC family transporter [Candidatus Methanomethylophilaceae archaeon]|nr:HlyC/CorC family transporter [Candidatus Methanomethylophilaceae archaeon]